MLESLIRSHKGKKHIQVNLVINYNMQDESDNDLCLLIQLGLATLDNHQLNEASVYGERQTTFQSDRYTLLLKLCIRPSM